MTDAPRVLTDPAADGQFAAEAAQRLHQGAARLNTEPGKLEQGLAKLVLTLVELIRQLLEREAIRQMDDGLLTEEQEERLGHAFWQLHTKIEELKRLFGLEGEELNLDLGPLGRLL